MKFNRNALHFGKSIEQPTMELIKNTPSLWNASLDDAIKYGGELTRMAIGAMNLRFDRKYIVVDTKVHMLMPNFYPAIPNWHTDGCPRGEELIPEVKKAPNIHAQEYMTDTRFHLIVTGEGCLTEFVSDVDVEIELPEETSFDLYKIVGQEVNDRGLSALSVPTCTVVEFDWWSIHRGIGAKKHEWRFLIRVCETDHLKPQTDLRNIIRTQQQVYVPEKFAC